MSGDATRHAAHLFAAWCPTQNKVHDVFSVLKHLFVRNSPFATATPHCSGALMGELANAQCNNGAVACQMCDRLNPYNPDLINMRRVSSQTLLMSFCCQLGVVLYHQFSSSNALRQQIKCAFTLVLIRPSTEAFCYFARSLLRSV